MTSKSSRPIDSVALGLAIGTTWAFAVGLLGIASRFGWGDGWRELLADLYVGYEENTAIGIAWGLLDGFVGGWLIGWLYNRFRR